jgi:hypothetical protein
MKNATRKMRVLSIVVGMVASLSHAQFSANHQTNTINGEGVSWTGDYIVGSNTSFNELFALMLCRQGVLGELVHGEGAYIHDLRTSHLREDHENGYQGQWRLNWARENSGNPYPTHGLGPVCQYTELEALKAKYIHPLWAKQGEYAKKMGGHGGMDTLMDMRLIHCLQNGLPLDISVYDSALWSSVVGLSVRSVARKGAPVEIPDFTRGGWKTAEPFGIVTL